MPVSSLLGFRLAMHHTAAQCCVVPLNLYYPDNVYYHEFVMWLQLAAAVALGLQQVRCHLESQLDD